MTQLQHKGWDAGLIIDMPAGSSADQIQAAVDTAPPGTQISFAAGTYRLDKPVVIQRSDVSLVGAGSEETVFVSLTSGQPAFQFGPTLFKPGLGAPVALTEDAATGDRTVELGDGHGFEVGDAIWLERANTPEFFAAIGDTLWQKDTPLRTFMATVVEADGQSIRLDTPLPFDFTQDESTAHSIATVDRAALAGLTIRSAYGPSEPGLFTNTLPAEMGAMAISAVGTRDLFLYDIKIEQPGSHGFVFAKSTDVTGLSLEVEGAHNKGAGGNGYGVVLRDVYGSDFQDLTLMDMRHAVLFASYTSAVGNDVHVADTNRDVNFHGGLDMFNTVTVDRAIREGAELEYLGSTLFFNGGQSYGAPTDPDTNSVVFREVVGTNKQDLIVAHPDGAVIDAYWAADEIHAGPGDDIIFAGSGADTIFAAGGRDAIDGGQGPDTVVVAHSSRHIQVTESDGWLNVYTPDGVARLRDVETIRFLDRDYAPQDLLEKAGQTPAAAYTVSTLELDGHGEGELAIGVSGTLSEGAETAMLIGEQDLSLMGNSAANAVTGNAGKNLISGRGGDDHLSGGGGNDRLIGGGGDDMILGGAGRDALRGASGSDVMAGGGGADAFVAGRGGDLVLDFELGTDRVVFRSLSAKERQAAQTSLKNGDLENEYLQVKEVENGVLLSDDTGHSLELAGLTVNDLDAIGWSIF
ncbi:MAG: calcium-binding protein [Pseudomonadota bacterium]